MTGEDTTSDEATDALVDGWANGHRAWGTPLKARIIKARSQASQSTQEMTHTSSLQRGPSMITSTPLALPGSRRGVLQNLPPVVTVRQSPESTASFCSESPSPLQVTALSASGKTVNDKPPAGASVVSGLQKHHNRLLREWSAQADQLQKVRLHTC
jgi:hypothetical protein